MKSNASSAARTVIPPASTELTGSKRADADKLLYKAHKVLVHYMPGAELPEELAKVRAMLDAHMFGRDTRAHRDDVVEVAREIDQILPPRLVR